MTPALLSVLADVHRHVNDPKARRTGAEQGNVADLQALSNMKAV